MYRLSIFIAVQVVAMNCEKHSLKVKFWAKSSNLLIYYHIFCCCMFVTMLMDTYTHVAMCRVSAYICVYVVTVKCEMYSL